MYIQNKYSTVLQFSHKLSDKVKKNYILVIRMIEINRTRNRFKLKKQELNCIQNIIKNAEYYK